MRVLITAALAAVLLATAGFSVAVGSQSSSPTKKKSAKRRRTARARPKAPPVSAQVRAAAQGRVSEWVDSASGVPVENAAAMVPFFEQLVRHQNGEMQGPMRILHYGDSHTAADEWTGSLRALFQARFGAGGGGYSLAGRPWIGYRRLDLRTGATRGWRSEGLLGRENDGMHGLGGVSVWTTRPHESVYIEADCQILELFYLRQPGGGLMELRDNGEAVERIPTNGELGPGYFSYETTPGLHRFQIETL
jgi:hypothetical protein